MPSFDTDTTDKIALLRGLRALNTLPKTFELVKVAWSADPLDTYYYSVMQTDEITTPAPPVSPIIPRIIVDRAPDWFIPVVIDGTTGDEEIELHLWDGDGVIQDLMVAKGEGGRVTLLYWFPQVDLLLPIWDGHIKFDGEMDVDRVTLKAAQGFRSTEEVLPDRGHTFYCNATFGGLLTTQAEINEGGCPYNLHLSGNMGINGPGSVPWTFCDRRTTQSCLDRGVWAQ